MLQVTIKSSVRRTASSTILSENTMGMDVQMHSYVLVLDPPLTLTQRKLELQL